MADNQPTGQTLGRAGHSVIDSVSWFVEGKNVGNLFNIVTTATGSYTSPDIFNTVQKGAMFFITVASVTVDSATLALNINAKDVSAGTYFPYARVSIDSLTASSSLQYMFMMYVGAASTPNTGSGTGAIPGASWGGNISNLPMPLPHTFQVVSSLTLGATTTTFSQTISYRVDLDTIM